MKMRYLLPVTTALIALQIMTPLSMQAEEAAALDAGPISFPVAAPWKMKESPRPMSKGGLTYVGENGQATPVDADIYHFGTGQGGGVEANVTRWENQFVNDADRKSTSETRTIGAHEVTIVRVAGTFLSGPPMLPASAKKKVPGQKLLGAIIPGEKGAVFVKMTGEAAAIAAADKAFMALIESALQ